MQAQQRKLKYHVAMSLDGFIAREDGTTDCFPGDLQAEHVQDYLGSLALAYDTVLMGRETYAVGLKAGVTDPYAPMDTYVFSRTLTESPHPRVHLVRDEAARFVRELKARPGKSWDLKGAMQALDVQLGKDIYLCGGGALAASLFEEGLVDEVLVKINPVLLGSGKPLVSRLPRDTPLELLSS
jgi:dihydrofolate reductase